MAKSPLAVKRKATLSAYEPSLREKAAILGEKGFKAVTGREPGYEARENINRYTGLLDLFNAPGMALSADDARRNIQSKQYGAAAGDIAGLAVGAIPIVGGALKKGAKKVVKEGVEGAGELAAKYLTEESGRQRPFLPPSHFIREENLANYMKGSVTPPVLYHGTTVHPDQVLGNITSFDPEMSQKTFNRPESMDNIGTWLSETPHTSGNPWLKPGAGMYAPLESGAIYPVHASIKNPWRPKDFDNFLDEMHLAAGRDPKTQRYRGVGSVEELRQKLIDEGHDGIYFSQGLDNRDQSPTWVALKPKRQIKSAVGNRGSFDPDEADITKARGGLVRKYKVR
jgi:hypothetical protein